ncbi:uncharacterized protein LOC144650123 [Oculina patagonica]
MNVREVPYNEQSGEAAETIRGNTRPEMPQHSTPVVPTDQPALPQQQQTSIATARSIPLNTVNPPQGYVMPPNSQEQVFPFHYGVPPYALMTFPAHQLHYSPSLRQIAPKPQGDISQTPAGRISSRPPDFIDTVKKIRKQLYARCGIDELQEPPEGEVYSKWRKSVMEEWKPHNMGHYLMVARLSNRCFRLVIEIPECLNVRVTQSDFIDLYGKSEEQQYKLLCDLLNGQTSFQDLKRRRRAKDAPQKTSGAGNTKELEEEIARLKSQNMDLRSKLEEATEERNEQRRRAGNLQRRLNILEKENEEELEQYRRDVDLLLEEKHDLGESFLSHQSSLSDTYSDTEEPPNMPLFSDMEQNNGSEMGSEAGFEMGSDSDSEGSEDRIPLAQVKKNMSTVTTSTPKVKNSARRKAQDDETDSSTSSSELNSETSDSERSTPQRPTETERLRMEAKGIKKKLMKDKTSRPEGEPISSKSNDPQTTAAQKRKRVPESKTVLSQPFHDEWDYDIKQLDVDEWVAVAYEQDLYFFGKIEKKSKKKGVCNVFDKG